jgi:hypothetical protein
MSFITSRKRTRGGLNSLVSRGYSDDDPERVATNLNKRKKMMKIKIYAMVNERGHLLDAKNNLKDFIDTIIQLEAEEPGFFEGYKPVVFVEEEDEL